MESQYSGVIDWGPQPAGDARHYTAALYLPGQPERLGLKVVERCRTLAEAQRRADRRNRKEATDA